MTLHYCDRCKKQIKFPTQDGVNFKFYGSISASATINLHTNNFTLYCLRCLADIIEDGQPVQKEEAK